MNLSEIQARIQSLAQKRTWVKKGLIDLLDSLSSKLTKPDEVFSIDAELFSVEDEFAGKTIYSLRLSTSQDYPAFRLLFKYDRNPPQTIDIQEYSASWCREVILALPEAFETLLANLSSEEKDFDEAIDLLTKIQTSISN